MTAAVTDDALDAFVGLLHTGDRVGALALVREIQDGGLDAETIVRGLFAGAQRRVGELWQSDEWSIADEHVATGVVDHLLAVTEAEQRPALPTGPRVAVVCAEDEWHVLPARMLATQLAIRGVDVTFLGGSTPRAHLERWLRRHRPDAVALSCTLSSNLPGARRCIVVAHRVGVPVLAGGTGFGEDDRRALAVGADAWAVGADRALAILAGWAAAPPDVSDEEPDEESSDLRRARDDVVARSMVLLEERWPPGADLDRPGRERAVEQFGRLVDHVATALDVDDDRLLSDHVRWTGSLLASRRDPAPPVSLIVEIVRDALPGDLEEAARLLDAVS